jgi:FkbM family methyltransferase
MEKLKKLIKNLPPLNMLIKERDDAIRDKGQLLRRVASLTEERDRLLADSQDFFLKEAKGVIHIGANLGQERELYAQHNLDVLWIEPIPSIFSQLQENLKDFPKQRAFQSLLTDVDGKECVLHVANNAGASSSIFNLAKHKEIWPEVDYVSSLLIKSITLSTLLQEHQVDLNTYDTLVMDTQGSELLVLRGAGDRVKEFHFIKTEAADFEPYEGCCTLSDIENYLEPFGFSEVSKKRFARKRRTGNYYDVVFEQMADQASKPGKGN